MLTESLAAFACAVVWWGCPASLAALRAAWVGPFAAALLAVALDRAPAEITSPWGRHAHATHATPPPPTPPQVRLAAAHAVAKIGVRSGEPFRLQCYAILSACRQAIQPHSGTCPLDSTVAHATSCRGAATPFSSCALRGLGVASAHGERGKWGCLGPCWQGEGLTGVYAPVECSAMHAFMLCSCLEVLPYAVPQACLFCSACAPPAAVAAPPTRWACSRPLRPRSLCWTSCMRPRCVGGGGGAGGSVLAVNSAVKVSYSGSASMAPVGARWPGSGTSA